MIRFAYFEAFFVAFALAVPAWGAGGCGVGCSTTRGLCPRRMAARFAGSERVPSHVTTNSALRP
jgi:hypothetical protein